MNELIELAKKVVKNNKYYTKNDIEKYFVNEIKFKAAIELADLSYSKDDIGGFSIHVK